MTSSQSEYETYFPLSVLKIIPKIVLPSGSASLDLTLASNKCCPQFNTGLESHNVLKDMVTLQID